MISIRNRKGDSLPGHINRKRDDRWNKKMKCNLNKKKKDK